MGICGGIVGDNIEDEAIGGVSDARFIVSFDGEKIIVMSVGDGEAMVVNAVENQ